MATRLLHQKDINGSAEEVDPGQLDEVLESSVWVWLDITDHTPDHLETLAETFEFDNMVLEDVNDIELLPKFEDHGDHLYCVFHSLTTVDENIDTAEVDCILKGNLLVTLHDLPLSGVDSLWELTERHPRAVGCTDAAVLLARLGEIIGRRFLEVLVALDRRIVELNELALRADPAVLVDVQQLRRDESTIRMMLAPQRQLMASLELDDSPLLSDRARQRFGSAYDVHNQVVETLEIARALLNDTLDTYHGATAEKLNEVTRVLTVYAAIMLPLSIIVGFFGMNFSNLPWTESSYGIWLVTGAMAVFAIGSWIFFSRRDFVGGPDLGSASRRVGKSLAAVARAPAKPATLLRRSRNDKELDL
ncbi:MAG: magnesium transporter CorA family protein [Acidimicrobiales bacterium]